jgi:hypothetical protein
MRKDERNGKKPVSKWSVTETIKRKITSISLPPAPQTMNCPARLGKYQVARKDDSIPCRRESPGRLWD